MPIRINEAFICQRNTFKSIQQWIDLYFEYS